MAIESSRPLMTYADYLALPEGHYNLIEGQLIMTPAPSRRHQALQAQLPSALFHRNQLTRQGHVYGAPFDVLLQETAPAIVVQPDVLYIARDGAARLTEAGASGPPDLVIEIVSPTTTRLDGVKKRALYEAPGVREFWLVLADLDQIEVLRQTSPGRFAPPVLLDSGASLVSPLLPGFELSLTDLFETGREP